VGALLDLFGHFAGPGPIFGGRGSRPLVLPWARIGERMRAEVSRALDTVCWVRNLCLIYAGCGERGVMLVVV